LDPEKKLKDLGLKLPNPPNPVANYVPYVQTNNLIFLSGCGPAKDTKIQGKIGKDLNTEEGYKIAKLVGLNLIARLKDSIGDLKNLKEIIKLLTMVNASYDFKNHSKVANGCSDLLVEVFGEKAKHTRSAIGLNSLPNNIPVEIEMIVKI
tara:strand:- start:29250 stop:29699 length:450 start_codon:yes stop_codon:yes gene_type:complete